MSHASIIASLKRLIKQRLADIDPEVHGNNLANESDRAMIILSAALVEDVLVARLKTLMPSLNSDELDRMFQYEGPCGSFSDRLRMAQALGIIDRPWRRRLEILKDMRNAAAHSHAPITFETPEIIEAVAGLFDIENREAILEMSPPAIRLLFGHFCAGTARHLISESNPELNLAAIFEKVRALLKPSLYKLLAASLRKNPALAQKGKQR